MHVHFDFKSRRLRDLFLFCFKTDCEHEREVPIIITSDNNKIDGLKYSFSVQVVNIAQSKLCLDLTEALMDAVDMVDFHFETMAVN